MTAQELIAPQESEETAHRTRGATRRGRARPTPVRSHELDHVTLDSLRAYRTELTAEEGRVSYWRRLVQARIDVLVSGSVARTDFTRLQRVLTDPQVSSRRHALAAIDHGDDVPPLPDLADLWAADPVPGDDAARDALVVRLAAAEKELSSYRTALHERIDRATADLIARYHENPTTCLVALPLKRT